MSKRGADGDEGGGGSSNDSSQPPLKRVLFEPVKIGPISTLEELEKEVLQFQNKKLAQRLEQRNRVEAELRQRIEQLEKRQTQDDAVLNVVNRYWNQLNEDIRVLLQRFDAETADESENKNESEATTSFLLQLSTWDKEELDEKLANRVQVSKRAVAKVIQAFDRLMQRNEKIAMALKGDIDGEAPVMDEVVREANIEIQAENKELHALNTSLHKKYHTISLKMAEMQERVASKETEVAELRNQVDDLEYEISKVQARNDKLENHLAEAIEKVKHCQQVHIQADGTQPTKHHAPASAFTQKKMEELEKDLEEAKELANNRLQELDKLHQTHRDTLKEVEKLKMDIRQLPESVIVETTEYKCLQSQFSVLYNESMQLKTQLDEVRVQLQNSKNAHLRQIEMMESEELIGQKKLRTEVIQLEDALAQMRKEYEMLRIEFEQNLAANEQTGPINREMRHLITSLQNHNQQLKGEVHRYKRKYKEANAEIPKLKREIEDLEAKVTSLGGSSLVGSGAGNLVGGGGVNLIGGGTCGNGNNLGGNNSTLVDSKEAVEIKEEDSLGMMCSSQIKEEMSIKREHSEEDLEGDDSGDKGGGSPSSKKDGLGSNIKKEIKKEVGAVVSAGVGSAVGTNVANASVGGVTAGANAACTGSAVTAASSANSGVATCQGGTGQGTCSAPGGSACTHQSSGGNASGTTPCPGGTNATVAPAHQQHKPKDVKPIESELVRDLKQQIKKAINEQKEMKLLLDMYKGVSKEQRDKVQLMASERKLRLELEDLRQQLKKLQESKREDRKKLADEDALRKIKHLEEEKYQLQKQMQTHKQGVCWQEEEALLNEMEVTGQAFEDMQEQNSRLIQQLREKDDANFKLMSERIKSNQLHKLSREEKEALQEQVTTLTTQVEATNIVVRKLEEKERILQNSLATVEKELAVRQQAMEMHKRKAIESAQSAADLKLHLEKYHAQMKEAQQVVAEKTSALEAEAYKTKRLQEEIAQLRRKTERMKKIEMAGTLDEVLMEEIREYKEILTCPSCKVKRKDAVLSKCFHVFCYDCLKTRYETRQRKCPKCNAAFGANDYHRLYLGS